jgi:tyrosine-protein phosphatase YwqE
MDEALDLCRQAVEDGVGKACACPHAFRTYRPKPERILASLTELRGALRAEGIPLEEVLFRVALAGLVPVVVHPERNSGIAAKPERLRPWLEQGVLAVVGANSLTGAFGRRTQQAAQNLVRRGLVQGVVSDAHHAGRRPVRLTAAQRIVTGLIGREAAQRFFRDFACSVWEDEAYDA